MLKSSELEYLIWRERFQLNRFQADNLERVQQDDYNRQYTYYDEKLEEFEVLF